MYALTFILCISVMQFFIHRREFVSTFESFSCTASTDNANYECMYHMYKIEKDIAIQSLFFIILFLYIKNLQ